jgi:mitotic spindle assembly checkpoint protein MAD1
LSFLRSLTNLFFRAKKNNTTNSSPTSKNPISITKHLSKVCLSHARLLEEHGAMIALLRLREAEVVGVERRENEARQTVETLEVGMRVLQKSSGGKTRGPS